MLHPLGVPADLKSAVKNVRPIIPQQQQKEKHTPFLRIPNPQSPRLANVNLDFFEKAFELLYNRLSQLYTEKVSIAKFNFYLEMQEWVGALLVVINGEDLSKTPFRHVTIRSRIP